MNIVEIIKPNLKTNLKLLFVDSGIKAGFPSPAQDYIDKTIDLNIELIKNPATTFYARVKGNSLIDADIQDGDLLVVDKSLEAKDGDLAVCSIDGEFTLKYISIKNNEVFLLPANDEFKPIKIINTNDFMVWGVVTFSIKQHRRI
jgi:DNA polymerase V